MPRIFSLLLVLMLSTVSGAVSAQQYESFRFVGDMPLVPAGNVTGVEFTDSGNNPTAKLSFLNVAGLSTVYDVKFKTSDIIRSGIPVFMPSDDFGQGIEPSMNLDGVRFLTGRLLDPNNADATPPPHWFRMTLHNNVWSGVFRVADRVYSIDRLNRDNVVEVRTSGSANTRFEPNKKVKVTALIDEDYVYADEADDGLGMDSHGHIFALESMHVMDGLASDSLGVTLVVEQVIYQNASALSAAGTWLQDNADAFGVNDNLATFIFRGAEQSSSVASNFIVQGKSDHYQFKTAYHLGQFIGLPTEDNTLQSYNSSATHALQSAHWSESQNAYLNSNPLPAALTQTISYDAPLIEVTESPESAPIPDYILDSESEETSTPTPLGPQDDAPSTESPTKSSGGGAVSPATSLLLLMVLCLYRRRCV